MFPKKKSDYMTFNSKRAKISFLKSLCNLMFKVWSKIWNKREQVKWKRMPSDYKFKLWKGRFRCHGYPFPFLWKSKFKVNESKNAYCIWNVTLSIAFPSQNFFVTRASCMFYSLETGSQNIIKGNRVFMITFIHVHKLHSGAGHQRNRRMNNLRFLFL